MWRKTLGVAHKCMVRPSNKHRLQLFAHCPPRTQALSVVWHTKLNSKQKGMLSTQAAS